MENVTSNLESFFAGNSVSAYALFKSTVLNTGYTAKVVFISNLNPKIEFNLTNDSTDLNKFLLNLTFNDTTLLLNGDYDVYFSYTKNDNSERQTIFYKKITISPNILVLNTSDISHVEKVVEALKAAIEKRANATHKSYAIDGRSIVQMDFRELTWMLDKYEIKLATMKNSQKYGKNVNNKIKVYWTGNGYR